MVRIETFSMKVGSDLEEKNLRKSFEVPDLHPPECAGVTDVNAPRAVVSVADTRSRDGRAPVVFRRLNRNDDRHGLGDLDRNGAGIEPSLTEASSQTAGWRLRHGSRRRFRRRTR